MTDRNRRALLLLVSGFVVWSVAFVGLYALQALGCAYGWPAHRWLLVAGYIVSLSPLVWLSLRKPYDTGEPATSLSISALWANRAALLAAILVFLPVTFASACI